MVLRRVSTNKKIEGSVVKESKRDKTMDVSESKRDKTMYISPRIRPCNVSPFGFFFQNYNDEGSYFWKTPRDNGDR